MHTYHIHISGLVQGVGFRPFVCRLAAATGITGWVSNTNDGVHIEFNASPETAQLFYENIVVDPPANSIITQHVFEEIAVNEFTDFSIRQSSNKNKPNLLLTPDIALCEDCRAELVNPENKRANYLFTTCLQCGPRYSIIHAFPYDRENTSMHPLQMCDNCLAEYNDINNRRHYSQTNSCKACAIPLHLFNAATSCISSNPEAILEMVTAVLKSGSIIAVKGIGGYLLMCDATNEPAIYTLRARKQRPTKPLAILYANIEMAMGDVKLRAMETDALNDSTAPIVLCRLKPGAISGIREEAIAPGLDKIGLMLAYTPLLYSIATSFGKPLIATSGNISGSPILFKDDDALNNLFEVADYVLTYEREIVVPQDDSVLQFTRSGQKIILRRSRGLAPNYFPNPFPVYNDAVLAMGSELKSAFALTDQNKLYISQYLGNQGTIESQTSFKKTLQHLTTMLKTDPKHIIIDKHPNYFVSEYGKEIAEEKNIAITAIQHQQSHFAAVMAENNLLETSEPVLGIIWDGTGYGDDGQIWGGEIFIYANNEMERVAWLDYFPQLLGDKMSKEPRLSALSLLKNLPLEKLIIKNKFTHQEWHYYQQFLHLPSSLLTSSMGRLLDGIACILGIHNNNTYEGETVMQLEALARNCKITTTAYYSIPLEGNRLNWSNMLVELLADLKQKEDKGLIAWKVFFSLVNMVEQLGLHYQVNKIAFSGGVFQNALLVDLLVEHLHDKRELYFHQQLSPNDECIGFGQLACFNLMNTTAKKIRSEKNKITEQNFQFST